MQKILMSEATIDNKQVKIWKCVNKYTGKLEEIYSWTVWEKEGLTFQRAQVVSMLDYKKSFRYGHRFYVSSLRIVKDETSVLVKTPDESYWLKVKGFNQITNE